MRSRRISTYVKPKVAELLVRYAEEQQTSVSDLLAVVVTNYATTLKKRLEKKDTPVAGSSEAPSDGPSGAEVPSAPSQE